MITRGDIRDVYGGSQLGDLYGAVGFLKKVAKGTGKVIAAPVTYQYKAVKYLADKTPGALVGAGRAAGSFGRAGEAIMKFTGKAAVLPLTLPTKLGVTALRAGAGAVFSPSSWGFGSSSKQKTDEATQKAAADAVAAQQGGYSTSAAGGYSGAGATGGGGGGGSDSGSADDGVSKATGSLTVDPNAPAAAVPAGGLVDRFMSLSLIAKAAIVGGVGAAGYFGYQKFKRRGGGSRHRSKRAA